MLTLRDENDLFLVFGVLTVLTKIMLFYFAGFWLRAKDDLRSFLGVFLSLYLATMISMDMDILSKKNLF